MLSYQGDTTSEYVYASYPKEKNRWFYFIYKSERYLRKRLKLCKGHYIVAFFIFIKKVHLNLYDGKHNFINNIITTNYYINNLLI